MNGKMRMMMLKKNGNRKRTSWRLKRKAPLKMSKDRKNWKPCWKKSHSTRPGCLRMASCYYLVEKCMKFTNLSLGHRLYRQYYKQNHIPFKPKEDDKCTIPSQSSIWIRRFERKVNCCANRWHYYWKAETLLPFKADAQRAQANFAWNAVEPNHQEVVAEIMLMKLVNQIATILQFVRWLWIWTY